jgi:hypothetical protein
MTRSGIQWRRVCLQLIIRSFVNNVRLTVRYYQIASYNVFLCVEAGFRVSGSKMTLPRPTTYTACLKLWKVSSLLNFLRFRLNDVKMLMMIIPQQPLFLLVTSRKLRTFPGRKELLDQRYVMAYIMPITWKSIWSVAHDVGMKKRKLPRQVLHVVQKYRHSPYIIIT